MTKKLSLLAAFYALVLWGCENAEVFEDPAAALNESQQVKLESASKSAGLNARSSETVLGEFSVQYLGQNFDGVQTTFSYSVTGPAENMHFRLELPECAPINPTFEPDNGTSNNNDEFINPGVTWHPSVGSGTTNSFYFEVAYPGYVKEGLVLVSIKSKGTTVVGEILGACARVFNISGKVYADANENQVFDNNETGIGNASVGLYDDWDNLLTTTVSGSNGDYLFECFPQGSYTVRMDTTNVVGTATTYLEAVLPVSHDVVIGPDATGNNFAFTPKTSKIIEDIESEILITNGKSSKYWKTQLKAAVTGKGKAEIDAATLIAYISQIRMLQLPDVYALEGGDGLMAAYNILKAKPGKSDEEKLRIELLTTEFNHVAGFGLVDIDPALQLVLIGWGESILFDIDNTEPLSVNPSSEVSLTAVDIGAVANLFSTINRSSGGGGSGN